VTPAGESPRSSATSRIALAGLTLLALVLLAAALAPWISPQDPTIWHGSTCSTRACRPGRARPGHGLLAWSRRPGPRHAVCHPLRPRTSVAVASQARRSGRDRREPGLAAAWLGGWLDGFSCARAVSPALVPSILIALRPCSPCSGKPGQDHRRASSRFNGRITPRTAARGPLVDAGGIHRRRGRLSRFRTRAFIFSSWLPNCLPPLLVLATVQVAAAITLEATLSLARGCPITQPSLGLLISNGFQLLARRAITGSASSPESPWSSPS